MDLHHKGSCSKAERTVTQLVLNDKHLNGRFIMRWWFALSQISVYSYTKQIVYRTISMLRFCTTQCVRTTMPTPCNKKKFEKNSEQSWEKTVQWMWCFFLLSLWKWEMYYKLCWRRVRTRWCQMQTHKNYDNKFLVCSNLMSTFFLCFSNGHRKYQPNERNGTKSK